MQLKVIRNSCMILYVIKGVLNFFYFPCSASTKPSDTFADTLLHVNAWKENGK